MSRTPSFLLCLILLITAGLAGCKRPEKEEAPKPGGTNAARVEQDKGKAAEHDEKKPDEHEEKAPELVQIKHNSNGESELTVLPEVQKRIALVIAPAAAAEHAPEIKAYGSVLDPSPLIALHGELAASEASIGSLKTIAQRTRALFEAGENVSRKTMEAAEADLQIAQIKARTAQRQLAADWGETIARLDTTNRQDLVDKLAEGKVHLIRVDLYAGENVPAMPKSARVSTIDNDRWVAATVLSRAAKIDPRTLGEGFILESETDGPALRPGSSVTALLQLPGEPVKGAVIPRSAILRVEGKTFVYIAEPDNKFVRHEVSLEFPTDSGWFTHTGVAPGERIAVESAQILLSEEQKSQIKAD